MDFDAPVCQGDILLVDDLADNIRILVDTLSGQGYRIRAVRNGAMALIGAKAAPPDVILLDIRMPLMDGFEVCRQLKADATTRHIPVIFLSALDEASDRIRAFDAGGADYISKPFLAVEVRARVQHHLTIRQLRRQVMAQQERLASVAQQTAEQATAQASGSDPSLSTATRAAYAILAYADRLAQTPDLTPERALHLQNLRRQGQAILRIFAALGE
ncbi:response regulator [Nodosilinea sp. LEGE 06152]|uniref:response regulator n=1 Tax=Nodosilinea sp. LEGE 06152 TaxID=2777966 RepID=UPI00187EC0D2|nr:response regulator [Nodosilinea sp. LEGE 06152]MBE9156601.1 response regulator [Nodosilinea sp. LEGE 06152]